MKDQQTFSAFKNAKIANLNVRMKIVNDADERSHRIDSYEIFFISIFFY